MSLRDDYMRADRDPVTSNDLASLIRRSFAAQLADNGAYTDEEHANLIKNLLESHHASQVAEARAKDDDRDADEDFTDVYTVTGDRAERWYVDAYVAAYVEEGSDEAYAREGAMWPDSLPRNAPWNPELLADLARLETGQDLVTGDYIRACIRQEEKKNGRV